ncbi:MAG: tyrosine-type recombinase/integrase [Nanoarchaeota archaeon]|nr:tyrosine-type recombinase/integrase [Nanoarchaeota archaeon]
MSYVPIDVDEAIKKEGKRRRYSPRTIKTYQKCAERFLLSCRKTIDKVSKKDAREFLSKLSEKNIAGSTLHVYHMAIRFLLEDVLNKKMKLDIRCNRRPKRFPSVLTKEEIRKLLNAISNWKHRLMIEFLYSSGLRVSELLNMKIKDLELDKNYGYVRNGKGGKDRLIVLSKIVKEKIKNLIEMGKLEGDNFLFQSNRNKKYHVRSIQKIIRNASKKAKLGNWKEIHPHTLRHSFATHLIENGYDVTNVQAMLGHKSPETSLIYVHMASPNLINIKSPLDNL